MNSIINHNEQIIDQLLNNDNESTSFINISNNDDGDSIINDDDIYCGSWFIDRTPDFNILNDLEFNRNQVFDLQLDQARRLLINRQIVFDYNSDYIPFSNSPIIETFESIEILVDDRLLIKIDEDDCDCCICMESNVSSKICQLNCGHKFCADCTLENVRINYKSPLCPLCRTNIITITVPTQEIYLKFI
jgi:hypothetical protein